MPVVEAAEVVRAPRRRGGLTSWLAQWLALGWLLCLQYPGWLLSLGLHTVMLTCLAVIVTHAERKGGALGVEASLAAPDAGQPFENILESVAVEVAVAPGGGGDEASVIAEQAALSAADQAMGDVERLGWFGSGGGSRGGEGEGVGSGKGPGLGAGFFGTKTAGKTFVYVVDMSGSMKGRRFDRAQAELVRSIGKLGADQSFFVYFFNDRAYPLFDPRPAKGLLPATNGNKSRASRWIRTREPFSMTNPTLALQMALAMQPQVIYFLTDGELDDPDLVRRVIREANSAKTQIHTIAFENEDGVRTLETIAAENNGTFRFIPVR
ncbi:MAG: VWA domain-containing protein [Planctomycetaceae bacterium]